MTIRKKAKRLFTVAVGPNSQTRMWLHRCERYGETNMCVRPDHIVFGTKSDNAKHWHQLRADAGLPHPGAEKMRGRSRDPDAVARGAAKIRGVPNSPLHRARIKATAARLKADGPYPCPVCGKIFVMPNTRSAHVNRYHA